MDANILKTAISSIIYVAEEDIQKINDFDPTDEKAYSPEYLFSIANIAQNVSKSFKGIEKLIESHVADIANIDGETLNGLIAVATNLAKALTKLINENPREFLHYIDFEGIMKTDRPDQLYGAIADAGKTASQVAAEISEQHRKEGSVCSSEE